MGVEKNKQNEGNNIRKGMKRKNIEEQRKEGTKE
jgi:hypothetical protein